MQRLAFKLLLIFQVKVAEGSTHAYNMSLLFACREGMQLSLLLYSQSYRRKARLCFIFVMAYPLQIQVNLKASRQEFQMLLNTVSKQDDHSQRISGQRRMDATEIKSRRSQCCPVLKQCKMSKGVRHVCFRGLSAIKPNQHLQSHIANKSNCRVRDEGYRSTTLSSDKQTQGPVVDQKQSRFWRCDYLKEAVQVVSPLATQALPDFLGGFLSTSQSCWKLQYRRLQLRVRL